MITNLAEPNPTAVFTTVIAIFCTLIISPVSAAPAFAGLREPIVLESPNVEGGGWFGAPVSWVPDVNEDRKADILVGAPFEDPGPSPNNAGRVYLFDGATQVLLREVRSPNQVVNGSFGFQLTGIEDVNGDGSGDLIVSAQGERTFYVIDGTNGRVIHKIFFNVESLSAVPDVNGDGRPDIVVSDWSDVYVFSGATGEQLNKIFNPNPNAGTGTANGATLFGFSVSGIPDVNGDNRGDVIASAVFEDLPSTAGRPNGLVDAGKAYVFDGATGALLHELTSPDERAGGQFGRSVVGVPDLNGDGRGEFGIIQVGVTGPPGIGKVYTYDGANGTLLRRTAPIGSLGNGFSYVTAVNDMNSDGKGEFLVLANQGSYLFDGATSEMLIDLPVYPEPGIANPIAGLPDVNGDGRGELIIAAPNSNRVYLYLSDSPSKPPEPAVVGRGEEGITVRLTGEPGDDYELQASEDLIVWKTLVIQTHVSQVTEFLDTEAKNISRRFYRTLSTP